MNEKKDKSVDDKDLKAFDTRLSKANKLRGDRQPKEKAKTNEHLAYRIGMELVVATVVGGFIGWYLDKYFDTKPWLLLTFLLLGIGAGFKNVLRSAKILVTTGEQSVSENDETKRDDP
jgi:ATP synthase protein I